MASTAETQSEWASSKQELRDGTLHRVTGYSGRYVIRFPDLEALIANEALPERLMAIALREVLGSQEDARKLAQNIRDGELDEPKQIVKDLVELQRFLTIESVVAPELTLEDVESGAIDARDFELLRQIAMRERNTDAKGVFLGVVPLDVFTTFRETHELIGGDKWADGAGEGQGHPAGLVESCPGCQAWERALATGRGL